MTNHQSRTHPYIQFRTILELTGNHFTGGIRYRAQTFNKQRRNSRNQFHHCSHFYTQTQDKRNLINDLFPVFTRQNTDSATNNDTQEQRFTHDTKLLLHTFGINIQLIEAWNSIQSFINHYRKRNKSLTERLGNRNTFHLVIITLKLFACQISHD